MMSHLDEIEIERVARARLRMADPRRAGSGDVRAVEHLADCERCRDLVEVQEQLIPAARALDERLVGRFEVPTFDTAVLPRLMVLTDVTVDTYAPRASLHRAAVAIDPVPTMPAPGLSASWKLAAVLVARQAQLLPRTLVPLSLLGLVAAVVVAVAMPTQQATMRVLTAVISLVALAGGAAVCSRRWDPRGELLHAMTISPAVVFLARLVLVLLADLLGATVASVVTVALLPSLTLQEVVLGWLGPALLAASVAVVLSVWRSVWVGSLVGSVVWFLATARGISPGADSAGLGAIGSVWTNPSAPWTLVLSALLLGVAVRVVAAAPLRPAEGLAA